LWAALPALVAYAAFGSSRSLSMGPEATTALMTAIALRPLAAGTRRGVPPRPPHSHCWSA